MSRYSRDDDRVNVVARTTTRELDAAARSRIDDLASRGLDLPRTEEREPVELRDRTYSLNGSETRALATAGAFRVIDPNDLGGTHGKDVWHGDWRQLSEQGLITHETLTDGRGAHHLVALTREGKDLLDAHATARADGRRQEYYAGVVKPRELRHDSQVLRLYQAEAALIEREGGRVTRVVLDYELKRDYQQFLNRSDRGEETDLAADQEAFARSHGLSVIDGHLELPDRRIDYENEDGRLQFRDVELVTEHYSRGQLSGKARAGFTCYRAGSAASAKRGGTPFDPRHLTRL